MMYFQKMVDIMITLLSLVVLGIVLLKVGGYLWTSNVQRERGEEGAEGNDSDHTRSNMLTNIGNAVYWVWKLPFRLSA
jgi:hypothetical protein